MNVIRCIRSFSASTRSVSFINKTSSATKQDKPTLKQGMYPACITLHQTKAAEVTSSGCHHSRNAGNGLEEKDALQWYFSDY